MNKMVDIGVDQKTASKGQDHRGLQFLTGVHNAGEHFHIPDAEISHSVVIPLGLDQHILGRY